MNFRVDSLYIRNRHSLSEDLLRYLSSSKQSLAARELLLKSLNKMLITGVVTRTPRSSSTTRD